MSFLRGLANGAHLETLTPFWALLIVAAAIAIVIGMNVGIGEFIAAGEPAHEAIYLVTPCGITGHHYQVQRDQAHHIRWRCATCGEGVLCEDESHDRNRVAASVPQAA